MSSFLLDLLSSQSLVANLGLGLSLGLWLRLSLGLCVRLCEGGGGGEREDGEEVWRRKVRGGGEEGWRGMRGW